MTKNCEECLTSIPFDRQCFDECAEYDLLLSSYRHRVKIKYPVISPIPSMIDKLIYERSNVERCTECKKNITWYGLCGNGPLCVPLRISTKKQENIKENMLSFIKEDSDLYE